MTYLEKMFSLAGKVAIVTGAKRGLGKAISTALHNAGAEVLAGVFKTIISFLLYPVHHL